MRTDQPRPYANPYLAGMSLGLVLLAAFLVAGRGLGASGAFAALASHTAAQIAPASAGNAYFQRYLQEGPAWLDWLVVEMIGVVAGAVISARRAGRQRIMTERGTGVTVPVRLACAAAGGMAMGVGAVLARGCTSGQALTGGALLSVGSWIFMLSAFAAGYAVAPLLRGLWR
jgi:uncharacterized protein